jgi:hypothetical protein
VDHLSHFSGAKQRTIIDGIKSGLFLEYIRLLTENQPTYFYWKMYEMKKEHQDIVSSMLVVNQLL